MKLEVTTTLQEKIIHIRCSLQNFTNLFRATFFDNCSRQLLLSNTLMINFLKKNPLISTVPVYYNFAIKPNLHLFMHLI